jgi:hypothetical protein
MENIKLTIKGCAVCPFRIQVGFMDIKENCYLQRPFNGFEEPRNLEYSIKPLGRDKECPLPMKIRFEV